MCSSSGQTIARPIPELQGPFLFGGWQLISSGVRFRVYNVYGRRECRADRAACRKYRGSSVPAITAGSAAAEHFGKGQTKAQAAIRSGNRAKQVRGSGRRVTVSTGAPGGFAMANSCSHSGLLVSTDRRRWTAFPGAVEL